MDTSEQYIEMCRKAVEIQSIKPDCDNLDRICGIIYRVYYGSFALFWAGTKDDELFVWLPRLDQLWKLAKQTHPSPHPLTEILQDNNSLEEFIYPPFCEEINHQISDVQTREQLLLAFVMKIKFHKIWDKGDWTQEE